MKGRKRFPLSRCDREVYRFPGASVWSKVIAPPACVMDVDENIERTRPTARGRQLWLRVVTALAVAVLVTVAMVAFAM